MENITTLIRAKYLNSKKFNLNYKFSSRTIRKKFFIKDLLCVLIFIFLGVNTSYANRLIIPLNDGWKFIREDNPKYALSYTDDSTWRIVNLPHDWSIEGPYDKNNPSGPMGGYMPCGTGWYRNHFEVEDSLKGKRFFICFDGAYMRSQVWINGRMIGEYPNGYNSFRYDITPFIRFGEKNLLAVRIDNSLQPSSRWYSGSGLYRKVHLLVTEQLHFIDDSFFVKTSQASSEQAEVIVKYKVICNNYPETIFNWTDNTSFYVWTRDENNPNTDNHKNTPRNRRISKQCELVTVIYDSNGTIVARTSKIEKIGDFSETQLEQKLTIKSPKLWSTDKPYLYRTVTSLYCEGVLIDNIETKTGIRTFSFSAEKGMELNGKPLKVQGVCLHQNVGCFGSAVPVGVWRERLEMLKKMGCNAVRNHYPLFPEFYEMCDSLGILVSIEILDEWNRGQEWGYSESSYGKLAYTYHLYFDQWHDTDMRRMIRNARNHPSIFIYNIGNEIPNQRIKGIEIAQELKQIVREEDPTRPITAACDFFVGANIYGFMDQLDIAGYNYIDRIHKDSLYAAEHQRYPNRILLGTETYHATKNHVSVRDIPSVIGEFVWVGYDYLGEIVWPDYRGWSAGILDIAGFPKPEYYLRKSYWSNDPVVHIGIERSKGKNFMWDPRDVADHWNWEGKETEDLPIYVYSNCDEVELILNGKTLGRKKVEKNNYYAIWFHKFEKGQLTAIGYRNGRKVTSHEIKTAGDPADIKVTRIFPSEDVIRVELQVVDKKGTRVPNSNIPITIKSNLEVLGLDNGEQYDPKGIKYTSKSTCMTADGRMVAYLKPNNKNTFEIKFTSDIGSEYITTANNN